VNVNRLTFYLATLANMLRLPLFKNSKGQPAHTTQDGSDWSPAQWFEAFFGEVGEWCRVRCQYEAGLLNHEEYQKQASKEAADIQIYFLIWCRRMFDVTAWRQTGEGSPAQRFMEMMAHFGEYANEHKKFTRGDLTLEEFANVRELHLTQAGYAFTRFFEYNNGDTHRCHISDRVAEVHPDGVNIDQAVVIKFNEVSKRVDAPIMLAQDSHGLLHVHNTHTNERRYN
jgi:hypothetical protein